MRHDGLVPTLEHEGCECARLALISRAEEGVMVGYLRGQLAGLARATWLVTDEPVDDIEERWLKKASTHFTVKNAEQLAAGAGG